jgi:SAM-dependent methyltransferase
MSEGPYADDELAALYDLFFADIDDDVAMYEQFARRGATPSLELGIGSGRVGLRLARAGLDVVGLDTSPSMLARLRSSLDDDTARRVRIVEADIRAFDLGERFDLIFCAANSFQHLLTTVDQVAALTCIAKHLAPGGLFVARVMSPSAVDWSVEDRPLELRRTLTDPATGDRVMRFTALAASPGTMTTTATWIFDRVADDGAVRRRTFDVTLRYMTCPEWELVLERAALRLAHLYGDHDLSPYSDDSDTMIIVAQHA